MQAFNADSITFTGSTEAVMTTYTGHDGFPDEPVTEYLPVVYAQNPHGDRKGCFLGKARHSCHVAEEAADKCARALAARAAAGLLPVGFVTVKATIALLARVWPATKLMTGARGSGCPAG